MGHNVHGYTPLPDYPAHQPDPSIRDSTRYNSTTSGENNYGGSSGNTTSDMYGNPTTVDSVYKDTTSGDLNAFYGSKSRGRVSDTSSSDDSSSESSDSSSDSGGSSSGSEASDSESDNTSRSGSSISDSDSSASTRNRRQYSGQKANRNSPLPVPAVRSTNNNSNNSLNSASSTLRNSSVAPAQTSPVPNKPQPMQGMRKATTTRGRDTNTLLVPTTISSNTNTSSAVNYSNVSSVSSGIDLMGLGEHTHSTQTSGALVDNSHLDFDTVEPLLVPTTTAQAVVQPAAAPGNNMLPFQPTPQMVNLPLSIPANAGQNNISAAYNPIDAMYSPSSNANPVVSSNALVLGTGLTGLVAPQQGNNNNSAMMGGRGAATMNIVPGTGLAMNTTNTSGMMGDSNSMGGLSNSGRMMMQPALAITQPGAASMGGGVPIQQQQMQQQPQSIQGMMYVYIGMICAVMNLLWFSYCPFYHLISNFYFLFDVQHTAAARR